MHTALRSETFDAYAELAAYNTAKNSGAESIFIGNMRGYDKAGQTINKMFIEHYSPMTEQALEQIAAQALERYTLDDVLILHRVGEIQAADNIVLIACWSQHREAAINASRFLIEALKSNVPFWKKEWHQDSSSWVSENTKAHYES